MPTKFESLGQVLNEVREVLSIVGSLGAEILRRLRGLSVMTVEVTEIKEGNGVEPSL